MSFRSTTEDRRLARQRGREWREFRRQYLYSQPILAQALGCCRRTIAGIETGATLYPSVSLLRKFDELQFQHQQADIKRAAALRGEVA